MIWCIVDSRLLDTNANSVAVRHMQVLGSVALSCCVCSDTRRIRHLVVTISPPYRSLQHLTTNFSLISFMALLNEPVKFNFLFASLTALFVGRPSESRQSAACPRFGLEISFKRYSSICSSELRSGISLDRGTLTYRSDMFTVGHRSLQHQLCW